jgi:hypothetical protein
MREFILTGVVAALDVRLLAVPASASFEHHFSVMAKQISGHSVRPPQVQLPGASSPIP